MFKIRQPDEETVMRNASFLGAPLACRTDKGVMGLALSLSMMSLARQASPTSLTLSLSHSLADTLGVGLGQKRHSQSRSTPPSNQVSRAPGNHARPSRASSVSLSSSNPRT